MPKKRNIDLIAALFVGAISLVFWSQLKDINSPMDVIFPKSVLIVMFVLCGILLIKAFTKPDLKELFAIKNRNMVALGAICLVVWVALLGSNGFHFNKRVGIHAALMDYAGQGEKDSEIGP